MPTLLNINGFKFFFYANEHEPMHIHVTKGEAFAKIELDNLRVIQSYIKAKDLKKALEIVSENRIEFIKAWHEWFN